MDYLLIVLVAVALSISSLIGASPMTGEFLVALAIVFYACELLIIEHRSRWDGLGIASIAASAILAVRGLF